MDWTHVFEKTIMGVLSLIVLLGLVAVILRLVFKGDLNWGMIQALVAVGLFVIAIYGLAEYATKKAKDRPYVTLMDVKCESNLNRDDIMIEFPRTLPDELQREEYKDKYGKMVSADYLRGQPAEVREIVEEVLINMNFRNTGPIGATRCSMRIIPFLAYNERQTLKEHFENEQGKDSSLSPDKTKRIEALAENINLMPSQEQMYGNMFHASTMPTGRQAYYLCETKYDSIKDKGEVTSDKRKYCNYTPYRLYYRQAYTHVYFASLVKSETHDQD